MEDLKLRKSVIAFIQTLIFSALSLSIFCAGIVLENFQAVLYSAILEMCGMFIIGVFVDNFGENA